MLVAKIFGTLAASQIPCRHVGDEIVDLIFGLLPKGREAAVTTENVGSEKVLSPQRVVRRLAAAEGYLELELPNYALAELNGLTDSGPFAPIAELFRGEALQAQEKYADAIEPLHRAAQMFPAPFNQRALLALSNCYRHDGQIQLADETAAALDMPDDVPVGTKLIIAPIFHISKSVSGRITEDQN